VQRVDYVCPWCNTKHFTWLKEGPTRRGEATGRVCPQCGNAVSVLASGVEKLAEQARF